MRKVLLLAVAALAACAKTETPAADTAAAAPPPPPAPAALTAADMRGTWTGTGKAVGTDSVSAFSFVSTSDSTAKIVFAGSKDSVNFKIKYDADSSISTSAPYTDPNAPKKSGKVTFHSIARLKDGKLVGVAHISPVAKPDTVIATVNWEATKAP
jgi:hypothetical protein